METDSFFVLFTHAQFYADLINYIDNIFTQVMSSSSADASAASSAPVSSVSVLCCWPTFLVACLSRVLPGQHMHDHHRANAHPRSHLFFSFTCPLPHLSASLSLSLSPVNYIGVIRCRRHHYHRSPWSELWLIQNFCRPDDGLQQSVACTLWRLILLHTYLPIAAHEPTTCECLENNATSVMLRVLVAVAVWLVVMLVTGWCFYHLKNVNLSISHSNDKLETKLMKLETGRVFFGGSVQVTTESRLSRNFVRVFVKKFGLEK